MQGDQPQSTQPTVTPSVVEAPVPQAADPNVITWSASEYIHHQKQSGWYAIFGLVVSVLAIILFLATHDVFGPILIVLMGAAFWMYAARTPSTLDYQIDPSGITIAAKKYKFEDFRSFSMIQEGGLMSLQLNPQKRFMPDISLYFSPEQVDQIAQALGQYLPHEDKQADAVDKLARFLRF